MYTKCYEKLCEGDLAYVYPSTRLSEGQIGIVKKVHLDMDGRAPHIEIEMSDDEYVVYDYEDVGSGGTLIDWDGGPAVVKIIYDPVICTHTKKTPTISCVYRKLLRSRISVRSQRSQM